jgi:SAM-dependent methyltransferase
MHPGRPVAGRRAGGDAESFAVAVRKFAVLSLVVLLSAGSRVAFTSGQQPSRAPDIYFAATPQPVVETMLKLAGVTPHDVVYDLGSGDGRIVILAAQEFGARGVGIEIDPRLVALSRQLAREGGVEDKVTFIEGDLFATDISGATLVTMWLTPSINERLVPKFLRELRPGTRIVSHQFPIAHWTPDIQRTIGDEQVFLWRVPPR